MIDWTFIGRLEGSRLIGYVPNPDTSNSGVTVAQGVDLGNTALSELAKLPATLFQRVKIYQGLTRQGAVNILDKFPLYITQQDAASLNEMAHAETIRDICAHCDFQHMPDRLQTVVASVTFQYGSPWKRCPHFWFAVQKGNINVVAWVLKHFGDAYAKRRLVEANYLLGVAGG